MSTKEDKQPLLADNESDNTLVACRAQANHNRPKSNSPFL
jgi:hypothetical protein